MLRHIAFVMDGNRRWAKKRGLLASFGHKKGAQTIETVVDFCLEKGIEYLSLYTFSIENFKRSPEEKRYLFDLLIAQTRKDLSSFMSKGIRVRFIGDRALFPDDVLAAVEHIEQETALQTVLNINFLFCYGARQEIVGGIKALVKKVKAGLLSEDDITDQVVQDFLWTRGIPEPDLIIRTGGEKRLSNFLLYQAAYSEFCFLDCLWPELTVDHLNRALGSFYEVRRNFGT